MIYQESSINQHCGKLYILLEIHYKLDAVGPIGKIHPTGKTAITFEQVVQFQNTIGFKISSHVQHSLFYDGLHYFLPSGLGGAAIRQDEEDESKN